MKKAFVTIVMIGLGLMLAGTAQAVTYNYYQDTWTNPVAQTLLSPTGAATSYSWTFDITDSGFNPETEEIIFAVLVLKYGNDRDCELEFADLTVGHQVTYRLFVAIGGSVVVVTCIAELQRTGKLHVEFVSTGGDFLLRWATLCVWTRDKPPQALPEPSTLLLLGTGLLGLGVWSRFRQRA